MAAYTQTFDKLTISSLTKEMHERTCGYWYVVQNRFGPHTAFRTRAHALRWLERLGLTVAHDLPEEGNFLFQPIKGAYRRSSHMDATAFDALRGETLPCLDNAQYTKGVITSDDDGLRTLHHMNCNLTREVYDYRLMREQEDRGE